MRIRSIIPALVAVLALPLLAQDVYKIDPVHSQVGFKVRHFVAKVSGRFAKFEGTIKMDPKDISKSSVEVSIDVASVNTDNEARDKHLRSADFFEAEKFPAITFKSTAVKEVAKGKLEVTGDLTIRGVTKQVTFPITNAGTREVRPGKVVGGFIDGALRINRMDFGVKYGPAVVGEDVDIELNVEAGKQDALK
jgi:polyisoprenoid-binding protein YceI